MNLFATTIIDWYKENKRDLPWRDTKDPYKIWISEIILQQTRVVQGYDYYCRFMEHFPDVETLAKASEDEVMKCWQGLGYYSRARNLHEAARTIAEKGAFPVRYEEVRALKGVGDYTAAAICSFAYRLPYATVDGNVFRVLARLFDIDLSIDGGEGKKYFTALAQSLLDERRPDLFNQAMMETFRTYTCLDRYGRLHVISSTQIVFHVRRILSRALGIPKSKIRVEKPRIGGGFGAKQTAVSEVYPAFVTMQTGRPAKLIFTRYESQIAGSPRHEMEVTVRLGADRDGHIRGLDLYTLSNTGAYGEHGPTTVGLSGHKSIPLYTGGLEAFRFGYDVVYTNTMAAGAYRGYGATQGIFALESSVNELAESLGIDPTQIREKNMLREGMKMPAYYGETANACALDRCMARCRELFGWEEKYPVREMGDGKVRTAGVAMAMQGSCISNVDVGSATVKLADDGTFNLIIGAADMGTGCDTILAQMVAECMDCSVDDVAVFGADTDASPYDSGSYASSTTYVTGKAVELACEELKKKLCAIAAGMLGCEPEETVFEDGCVRKINTDERVTLAQISVKDQVANDIAAVATASHSSPVSPPPYMVGMVEIELDRYTGEVKILDYVAVVDCGIAINPALARIQAEGGIVQGIGHTLFENITYDETGKPVESNFMQYKIPTRLDMGHLRVEFENSYEPTGPFGAKSIGEIVINTPAPAIAHAIYRATGVWHRELPITPEKILMSMLEDDFR